MTAIGVAGDSGQAGPLGLLVLVLLGVACYLLFKSMSRHLRKVRDEWPEELPGEPERRGQVPGAPDGGDQIPGAPDGGDQIPGAPDRLADGRDADSAGSGPPV
jgi:hypothetical protein